MAAVVAIGAAVGPAAAGLATCDAVGTWANKPTASAVEQIQRRINFFIEFFDRRMRRTPDLDSTISSLRKQLKGCATRVAGHYCFPLQPSLKAAAGRQNCGCSSVVERHLAKVDVASSSLVTR